MAASAWSSATAAGADSTAHRPAGVRTATADPAFSTPSAEQLVGIAVLRAFLAYLKQTHRAQRFCFVVETFPPSHSEPQGSDLLRMVWTTGQRIYDLPYPHAAGSAAPKTPPEWEGQALAWSKHVDLRTGVVDTQEAVGSSTYLVTRAWADRILGQCRRVGTAVRVAAFRPAR